jgi:hypothetical protein
MEVKEGVDKKYQDMIAQAEIEIKGNWLSKMALAKTQSSSQQ